MIDCFGECYYKLITLGVGNGEDEESTNTSLVFPSVFWGNEIIDTLSLLNYILIDLHYCLINLSEPQIRSIEVLNLKTDEYHKPKALCVSIC